MDELILLRNKLVDLERDNSLLKETEKKLQTAIQQLQDSEKQLKSNQLALKRTQEIAHVGSWVWDIATDTVTWSDELFQIFRLNPENGAVSYADHPKIYTHESMQLLDEAVRNTLESGESYEIDLEIIRGDGTSANCNARGFAKRDEKGKAIQLYGSFQDITERKKAEEQLKYLNQQLQETEQQLKASNQELSFGELELLASNQQLLANEQQLKAANQQLQANEQQLRAANQQLKASEQQLKEANIKILIAKEQAEKDTERYLGLINNLDSGIVIHAADTSILRSNQRASELLGLSVEQLNGKAAIDPHWQFIYEDKSPIPLNDYPVMRIVNTKKPIKNQVLGVVRKTDDIVWLAVNGIPIIDSNNEISEIIVSFIDITQRKQTETKLIKAKELAERNEIELKKVQEITHVGNWYLDIATNEVVWSNELYKMYGFDPTKPVPPYSDHKKLFTPESWEILSASLAKTSEKGIPYELELRTIRTDKSNGWIWVRGEALYIGLWGAAQDISERKKLEVDLSNIKDLLNETGNLAKVGGWEIDLLGNTLAWTEETFNIHELSPESQPDVPGAINYYHPNDRDIVASAVEKTIRTGQPFDFEARLITAKGNQIWVRASGKTVIQKDEVKGIRGSIQDITERKQAEIELKKAKEKAEENEIQLNAIIEVQVK